MRKAIFQCVNVTLFRRYLGRPCLFKGVTRNKKFHVKERTVGNNAIPIRRVHPTYNRFHREGTDLLEVPSDFIVRVHRVTSVHNKRPPRFRSTTRSILRRRDTRVTSINQTMRHKSTAMGTRYFSVRKEGILNHSNTNVMGIWRNKAVEERRNFPIGQRGGTKSPQLSTSPTLGGSRSNREGKGTVYPHFTNPFCGSHWCIQFPPK